MTTRVEVEGLLREVAPQALAALVRRYGDFGTAEDAVQEALLAAALQWPAEGVPDSPRGWLIAVAARRLIDWRRRESARRGKEAAAPQDRRTIRQLLTDRDEVDRKKRVKKARQADRTERATAERRKP